MIGNAGGLTVLAEGAGMRLDAWMAVATGQSRSAAQAGIAAGLVLVGGRPARSSLRVRAGDVVELLPVPERASAARPATEATGELRVVDEDEQMAVIDKPAGLVVHPAPGHPTGTLSDLLLARGDGWSRAGGEERAGIVHRLDRYTSGLMVVAKTDAAHRHLAAQLATRRMRRTYWALVHGRVGENTGTIDAPIARDPRQRKRMTVIAGGRESQTDFVVQERLLRHTALELSLRTGRTHQIRVHCAWIHRPLVNDPLYGPAGGGVRPALHARRLEFVHPGGEPRSYQSALPEDLLALLVRAREGAL